MSDTYYNFTSCQDAYDKGDYEGWEHGFGEWQPSPLPVEELPAESVPFYQCYDDGYTTGYIAGSNYTPEEEEPVVDTAPAVEETPSTPDPVEEPAVQDAQVVQDAVPVEPVVETVAQVAVPVQDTPTLAETGVETGNYLGMGIVAVALLVVGAKLLLKGRQVRP